MFLQNYDAYSKILDIFKNAKKELIIIDSYDNTFHDRYFILDKKEVYHYGTSINRIGYKTFSINIISDKEIIQLLINKLKTITY